MNKENLLRAADFVEKIPQEMFNMAKYRFGQHRTSECDSVGCIIGHCTALMSYSETPFNLDGNIDYRLFEVLFFGAKKPNAYMYLFSCEWEKVDNTPTGAAARMRYVAEYGVPETWLEEIDGKLPLSYAHMIKQPTT